MQNHEIAKLASEYAKEITVAKIPTNNLGISIQDGKRIAEFYAELYKGIYAALKEDLATQKVPQKVSYS